MYAVNFGHLNRYEPTHTHPIKIRGQFELKQKITCAKRTSKKCKNVSCLFCKCTLLTQIIFTVKALMNVGYDVDDDGSGGDNVVAVFVVVVVVVVLDGNLSELDCDKIERNPYYPVVTLTSKR